VMRAQEWMQIVILMMKLDYRTNLQAILYINEVVLRNIHCLKACQETPSQNLSIDLTH
jgi:hypothetical protein